MEQCRVFLRNLRWGVNEAQLRAMLQPAGFRVLEVKMVRKSYFGEHSLCSAFVTLDTHEAVDRLVCMLNGCNDYPLTPTAVFAERAVPRMAALRAVQAAPKVQAAPTVQAAPKEEEEEEEHPGDVYPNLEPELLAEKTEGTAEAAAKEQEDTAAEDTKAAAKEPEEEEEEKTEIFSSGEYQDTSPARSSSRRRKSRSSRRSRRKSRSSRRKSRSSRRKSRSSRLAKEQKLEAKEQKLR